MKKKLSCLFVTAMAAMNIATITPAFAADVEMVDTPKIQSIVQQDNTISTMAERTEWKYRIYNGVTQKRLWSNTEAKWLSDWINCSTTYGVAFE